MFKSIIIFFKKSQIKKNLRRFSLAFAIISAAFILKPVALSLIPLLLILLLVKREACAEYFKQNYNWKSIFTLFALATLGFYFVFKFSKGNNLNEIVLSKLQSFILQESEIKRIETSKLNQMAHYYHQASQINNAFVLSFFSKMGSYERFVNTNTKARVPLYLRLDFCAGIIRSSYQQIINSKETKSYDIVALKNHIDISSLICSEELFQENLSKLRKVIDVIRRNKNFFSLSKDERLSKLKESRAPIDYIPKPNVSGNELSSLKNDDIILSYYRNTLIAQIKWIQLSTEDLNSCYLYLLSSFNLKAKKNKQINELKSWLLRWQENFRIVLIMQFNENEKDFKRLSAVEIKENAIVFNDPQGFVSRSKMCFVERKNNEIYFNAI